MYAPGRSTRPLPQRDGRPFDPCRDTPRRRCHIAVAGAASVRHGPPSEGNIVATSKEAAQPQAWCAHRRALLAGLGGIGAAGVLAACGGDSTANSPAAAGTTAAGPASTGDQATNGTTATPAGQAQSAGAGATLADTADVPVGGGTVVGKLLIVQPVSGTFKAYDAACPHKGVLVSAPKDGVATCPAHKSTFSITDGSRLGGPATRGLTEVAVHVDGTKIVRS